MSLTTQQKAQAWRLAADTLCRVRAAISPRDVEAEAVAEDAALWEHVANAIEPMLRNKADIIDRGRGPNRPKRTP